jgi:hypothetical protein
MTIVMLRLEEMSLMLTDLTSDGPTQNHLDEGCERERPIHANIVYRIPRANLVQVCGKRVSKESSTGLLADGVVQDYSDIHTTVHSLLILPEPHFLQLLEYELARRDAQRLITYLLDAWRSSDSKEIPLKRLLHLCTHFIMGKEETPD